MGPIPATVSNVIWAEVALLIPALGGVLIAICAVARRYLDELFVGARADTVVRAVEQTHSQEHGEDKKAAARTLLGRQANDAHIEAAVSRMNAANKAAN